VTLRRLADKLTAAALKTPRIDMNPTNRLGGATTHPYQPPLQLLVASEKKAKPTVIPVTRTLRLEHYFLERFGRK